MSSNSSLVPSDSNEKEVSRSKENDVSRSNGNNLLDFFKLSLLSKIDLSNDKIGPDGAKLLSDYLINKTKLNCEIFDLNLSGNNLGSQGAIYISEFLTVN